MWDDNEKEILNAALTRVQTECTRLLLENRRLKAMVEDKYGEVHVEGIPDDEPCFIIRAQDSFAVGFLKLYYMFRSGTDDAECVRLKNTIDKFIKWPKRKVAGR